MNSMGEMVSLCLTYFLIKNLLFCLNMSLNSIRKACCFLGLAVLLKLRIFNGIECLFIVYKYHQRIACEIGSTPEPMEERDSVSSLGRQHLTITIVVVVVAVQAYVCV